MIERVAQGELPGKPHTRSMGSDGALRYELCLTRRGFDGPYTILYHQHRPHAFRRVKTPAREPAPVYRDAGALRWHLRPDEQDESREYTPLLGNEDLQLARRRPRANDETYTQYGDSDVLLFVQQGGGSLVSGFGHLTFRAGDYVFIPKGVIHRITLSEEPQHWLECRLAAEFALPRQYLNDCGQLRMDAPYSHRDFRKPTFAGPLDEGIRRVVFDGQRTLSILEYQHSPLDVVGYDGVVYPFCFAITDFQPKVGRVHLPPTIHATFAARGALVCSFVPRPVDFDPLAIPCPYPHVSVDVDEVIFYASDDFTSRTEVGPGSISLHPRGTPHGPHPGRYEESVGSQRTDELAVMIDCARPLRLSEAALASADPHYDERFADE